jgi:hypothetical protein
VVLYAAPSHSHQSGPAVSVPCRCRRYRDVERGRVIPLHLHVQGLLQCNKNPNSSRVGPVDRRDKCTQSLRPLVAWCRMQERSGRVGSELPRSITHPSLQKSRTTGDPSILAVSKPVPTWLQGGTAGGSSPLHGELCM